MSEVQITAILLTIASVAVCIAIAKQQKRGRKIVVLAGLFLGPVGAIGATLWWLKERGRAVCPSCAERVKAAAKVCKHCSRDIATS